jgi:hypothetical protein
MSATAKQYPKTVAEVVDILHANMTLNKEFFLASAEEQDLIDLHFSLGTEIRDDFGLWAGNEALLQSCRELSGDANLHVDDASMVIIRTLWEKVKKSNVLDDHQ